MTVWVAGVDLGSNSFRALLAQIGVDKAGVPQLLTTKKLKKTVRLAAGLDENNYLAQNAQHKALEALSDFSNTLSVYQPCLVRVVATNTFRVATNIQSFLKKAQATLSYPIEIISGEQEARLIYQGVASLLENDQRQRLVVDIGGGSTEFIIGVDRSPLVLHSLPLGCVTFSQAYFRDGQITQQGFHSALEHVRSVLSPVQDTLKSLGWQQAFGSSGTSKALKAILAETGFDAQGISAAGMQKLQHRLVSSGSVENARLLGIKDDRMPVLAGGLAIMMGIFEVLSITRMDTADGALRLGLVDEMRRDPQLIHKLAH